MFIQGKTLLYWAPILLEIQESMGSQPMPFFFHAGESNIITVQENLVDGVFLNTSRIGHGFGIQEFPGLWPLLSDRGILIESCPISNQVLGLVVDQRNHPIGQMLHHSQHTTTDKISSRNKTYPIRLQEVLEKYPNLLHVVDNMLITPSLTVSISNDDPGFWGIDALVSYDWYIAVLAWDLNLAAIKQLAIDSIVHSAASVEDRAGMLRHWSVLWKQWIQSLQNDLS
jgi:adenosine deaminase CECR1